MTTSNTSQKNRTAITAEPGKQELTVTREFDAPRELVFRAFTDRDLYVQWLGPRQYKMDLQAFDARDGGEWRYVQKDDSGNAFGFRGVFHEVAKPERIISTFEFEGLPEKGHVTLETALFEELPGNRTKLTNHVVYMSVADRDGMMQSGMEGGMNDSYSRLDELLAKSQQ